MDGLPQDSTGRPAGTGRTLTDDQGTQLRQLLDTNTPEALGTALVQ